MSSDRQKLRIGVLGSGKGSNMAALAQAAAQPDAPFEIVVAISDVADAGILDLARKANIPAVAIAPGKFRTKLDEEAEKSFITALQEAKVDLVVLAGFMRILKGEFLRCFAGKVVNIHPSLLPSFAGLAAWKQAIDYGVKITGCTVHFVDQGIDTGAIIAQQSVPVLDNDTAETLHARIQKAEWELYPRAIELLATGIVRVEGRRTYISNPK
ncbi:MAG: phosphoribosylglycinamide formyltransferase [Verrucomicrobiales bacterium]